MDLNETVPMDISEEEYESPKTLQSYDLIKLLGSGGQGSVYKARDKETDKIVALKVLNVQKEMNLEYAEKEVENLQAISNPCYLFISCYYDYYYDPGQNKFLIEMEYIEGRDLQVFADELSLFGKDEIYKRMIYVMQDLIQALKYIHSKNIIHRDIKPANILITYNFIPKLVDFGIACVSKDICDKKIKCCYGFDGTAVFMPPETVAQKESYFASDVWCLGATIFKVSTNTYCFDFPNLNNVSEIFQIVKNNNPKLLKTRNFLLNNAVNSCLTKNPFQRITLEQLDNLLKLNI